MAKPKNINSYLKSVPATHRPALKQLRAHIKRLYPKATEHIAYSTPLFKLHGHPLGGFQALKNHSSIFVWSGTALKKVPKNLLKGYSTATGTVRFAPDKPPSLKLLKAVLKAREQEILARWGKK